MKNILFLFIITLLFGCGPSKEELDAAARKAVLDAQDTTINITTEIVSNDKARINVERNLQIIKLDGKGGGSIRFLTIDGHEYIQWYTCANGSSDIGVAMCHNSDCSNEIHTTNK